MKFSFIIPVLNGSHFIDHCLDHVFSEKRPEDEVIIVDNGSTDNTLQIVSMRAVTKVLQLPKVTISALRNNGTRAASGDAFAFIDSDCLVCQGWRDAAEEAFTSRNADAAGAFYDLSPEPTMIERAWVYPPQSTVRRVPYLLGGNFVVLRDAFARVGGFDEEMETDEDTVIGLRLTKAGYVVLEVPQMRVQHLGNPRSMRQFIQKQRWHSKGIIRSLGRGELDIPLVMTFFFMFSVLLGIAAILGAIFIDIRLIWAVGLVLTAPILTGVYRVILRGKAKYLGILVVMYLIFYWIRSETLVKAVFRGEFARN